MSLNISTEEKTLILRLAARIRGQAGGLAKSRNKQRAAKRNGKLGGRPRKMESITAAA